MAMTKREFERAHVIPLRKVLEYAARYMVDNQTALTNLINDAWESYQDELHYNAEELAREAQAASMEVY